MDERVIHNSSFQRKRKMEKEIVQKELLTPYTEPLDAFDKIVRALEHHIKTHKMNIELDHEFLSPRYASFRNKITQERVFTLTICDLIITANTYHEYYQRHHSSIKPLEEFFRHVKKNYYDKFVLD